MRDLRVTLVQSMLHWEDPDVNRKMFHELTEGLSGATDLLVLPEMFTTGFTMRSRELAEGMDGPSIEWMRERSSTLDCAVYGSLIISEKGSFFNRGVFVEPSGRITSYDKRHLFRMADEHAHFNAGHERVVVDWRGWKLLLQVCYDLRFPVFSRSRVVDGKGDYDAALYVANWPESRRYPWRQLLIARAIENQAYVIGVNRVGMDGKGIHYAGDSACIDPRGTVIEAERSNVQVLHHVLDPGSLADLRRKFPVLLDADEFELR